MSKIEEILEKATKLREQGEAQVQQTAPAAQPVHSFLLQPEQGRLDAYIVDQQIKVNNPYIITVTQPASPVTEEYKKLKSIIIKMTNGEKFLNTIMVSSTLAGEGKTITSLNIAVALAQEYDHTVLLVDCDLRRPSISRYMEIAQEPGITDCLTRGLDVASAITKTGIGKLSVLPAGKRVPNPVELMSSTKMKDFISELKNRYPDRYVIIDTSPVLHFAEANVIASAVDGVIFVVRDQYVPVAYLKESLAILKHANVLGVVYNDVEVNRFNSYHRYNNYYGGYKSA